MNGKKLLAIRGLKISLAIGLAISLSSCASFQSGSRAQTGATATGAGTQVRPSAEAMAGNQTAAADAAAAASAAEQQRLINEINRPGQNPAQSGFRETVPTPVQPPSDNVVELNYEQADLRVVLEELADAVDATIIIDPTIADKVSIRTSANRPLTQADIWPLVRLLTRQAGVTLEQVGSVYYARKTQSNLPEAISLRGDASNNVASVIMQITPLVYVSIDSALEILAPLVEPDGRVVRISNNNTLAISGTASQLSRINELLTVIDADPFRSQGLHLYQLNNANAADVATELTGILAQIEGNSPAYQVKGLERINSLLVTAPANRGFEEIDRWVRILDADRQEQAEQLFHYRVKNLTAVDLAATLTSVFDLNQNERVIPEREPQQSPTQTFNLLTPDGNAVTRTIATPITPQSGSTSTEAVSANLRVTIVADEATNSLLIRANPRDYRQLLTTINQLDSVPLQVMINAVIAQITLTDETRFGVDWSRVADNAATNNISTTTSTSFLPNAGLGGLLFTKSFLDGAARVEATLEAIATNNEVRLLARPSLTVINNQEGIIQIGAEVPVQSGQETTVGGNTVRNIQYRPTGIELTITPRINADGVVNLTIEQALSSVDANTGIDGNPIFQNQEISTTVVVRDGENVVLGGLIQSNNGDLNTGVPFLNRVPVLGNLFSYQQDTAERKELFIVLRPEIINLNTANNAQYADILQRFELVAEMFEDAGL
ncbi:MAG: type II secretion system secretin GspD [Gammaproteobacteria bacterium]|nr:type II secretion system secretin GspD [Gammaproteobacteria bacterium]MDP2139721.1 type II secretion system secretin GspD [Gammaproteobacteria bacterium]MDP2348924.1 type II secretion system secretin GspD [Gammaproteobacteria bacterium]